MRFSHNLKADPFAVGGGRETEDVRVLFEDPYRVVYVVDVAGRTVYVVDVIRVD